MLYMSWELAREAYPECEWRLTLTLWKAPDAQVLLDHIWMLLFAFVNKVCLETMSTTMSMRLGLRYLVGFPRLTSGLLLVGATTDKRLSDFD
jgi:hypothetical protein